MLVELLLGKRHSKVDWMRWQIRARRTAALLLCLAVLAGCGSDDDSDRSTTDPDPATGDQQPPPAAGPDTGPGTDPEPDPDPDPTPAPGPEPEPNAAPTISGTPPQSVVVGSTYRFTPEANDPDGDVLRFEIENKPEWASFDSSTGELTGMPEEADVRNYSNIMIRVTDGEATAQLPAFSITVESIGMGTATLTWTAPTQRTDGSPLTDLTGYRVYWGTESRTYEHSAEIDNPTVTTYVINNLGSGTHYFATTAVSADGLESEYSNEASKTIQ